MALPLAGCPAPASDSASLAAHGTLGIVQIDCDGWIGTSTLIVGPDGTTVLLDVGNDSHADVVTAEVVARTGRDSVDATVLTHFHEDHAGGLGGLGVGLGTLVSRGSVGLGPVELPDGWDAATRHDLCSDAACVLPWSVELGDGARLTVLGANGWLGQDELVSTFPDDDDGENARSLVGAVEWGPFLWLWSGDLTGGGKSTPDVEAAFAPALLEALGGPPTLASLGHHGIDSSTHAAWVDTFFPEDGADRAALVGTNGSYLDAPADEVLDRLRGRVSGVWLTRPGLLTGDDDLLREAEGDVVIEVTEGGSVATLRAGANEDILHPE